MRRKKTSPSPPIHLQHALDWLAAPQQDDPLLDLAPLRDHIAAIGSLRLPILHRLKIDELLQQRAERIDQALTPTLLDVRLPLPMSLDATAQSLIGLRAELGETWLTVAGDASAKQLGRIHRSRTQICLQGIFNLSRQFIATLLISSPVPSNFWRHAQALFRRAHESVDPTATLPAEMSAVDARFKAMLALAVAQPEGLAPREIAFLADYLEAHAAATRIDVIRPDASAEWFWLDADLDQPPVSLARLRPNGERCLYFCFGGLADLAQQHLAQLNDGVLPLSLGLPPQAAGADYRNALARACECWEALRRRNFNRRLQTLQVEVCTQLGALWASMTSHSRDEPRPRDRELACSDWTLLNESPSGYAIEYVGGEMTGIVPGGAVGLRTSPGAVWQICLVRRARSKSSGHVELGLEILAPWAEPIRIQARASRNPEPPIPALLLPALAGLARGEAILAVRGDYNTRPFTLLQEHEARLQIAECVPQRTLVETSSIEVFEFIRDPVAS